MLCRRVMTAGSHAEAGREPSPRCGRGLRTRGGMVGAREGCNVKVRGLSIRRRKFVTKAGDGAECGYGSCPSPAWGV